jgi:hypothetical protein
MMMMMMMMRRRRRRLSMVSGIGSMVRTVAACAPKDLGLPDGTTDNFLVWKFEPTLSAICPLNLYFSLCVA